MVFSEVVPRRSMEVVGIEEALDLGWEYKVRSLRIVDSAVQSRCPGHAIKPFLCWISAIAEHCLERRAVSTCYI